MRLPFRRIQAVSKAEREVLNAVVSLHREFGTEAQFTREAIEHVRGEPSAGSLAGLAMLGLVTQRSTDDGLAYRATQAGHELAMQATTTAVAVSGRGGSGGAPGFKR